MDVPELTVTLTRDQARLLFELIQREIQAAQKGMCKQPELREPLRERIILGQGIRRQIPECYWR